MEIIPHDVPYFPAAAFFSAQIRDERGSETFWFRDERSEVGAMLKNDRCWLYLQYRILFEDVKKNKKMKFSLTSTDLGYLLKIFLCEGEEPSLQKNLQNLTQICSAKEKNRSYHGVI